MESPNATSVGRKVLTSTEPRWWGDQDDLMVAGQNAPLASTVLRQRWRITDNGGHFLLSLLWFVLRKTFLPLSRFLRQAKQCSSCWLNEQIVSTANQDHQTLVLAFNCILSLEKMTWDDLGTRILLRQFWCLLYWVPLEHEIFHLSEMNR